MAVRPCRQSPQVDGLISYLIEASLIAPSTFDPLIKYTVDAVAINNTIDRDAKAIYSTDLAVLVPSAFVSGILNINYYWSLSQKDIPLAFITATYTIEGIPTLLDAEPIALYSAAINVQSPDAETNTNYSGVVQPTQAIFIIDGKYTGEVEGSRAEGINVVWSGIVQIPTIIEIQNFTYNWSIELDTFDKYAITSVWSIEAEPTLFILPGGIWTIEAEPIPPLLLQINSTWELAVEPQWPETISLSQYTGEAQSSPPLSAVITYGYTGIVDIEVPDSCDIEVLVDKQDKGAIFDFVIVMGFSNP